MIALPSRKLNQLASTCTLHRVPTPQSRSANFGTYHSQAARLTKPYQSTALGAHHSQAKAKRPSVAMAKQDANLKALEENRLELVNVGHEGPSVSIPIFGLGVYQMASDGAFKAVSYALQNGYRHVDTAHLYQNEKAVGDAIRASKIPRDQVFITTKLWNSDHGYANTLRACDHSLKQLGVDYVDLYLVHSPLAPPQKRLDTWRAMEKILKSGKARSVGVSNYGVHHLKELFSNCEIRPSINQVELHPFNGRKELVEFCRKENIVVEAYSPLTQGQRLNDPTVVQIAGKHGKSSAQVLIRWCLQKNFVVIPKSAKPARILENSQVFDFELSESEMAKLDSLEEGFVTGWDPTTAQCKMSKQIVTISDDEIPYEVNEVEQTHREVPSYEHQNVENIFLTNDPGTGTSSKQRNDNFHRNTLTTRQRGKKRTRTSSNPYREALGGENGRRNENVGLERNASRDNIDQVELNAENANLDIMDNEPYKLTIYVESNAKPDIYFHAQFPKFI